jgi:hypothetical protein
MHTLTNRVETAWAASGRRYNLQRAAERREEWRAHHRRMIVVFEDLAELGRLIDSAAEGGEGS